ncbi:hypothetical protein O6H91_05G014700 [Diphasiastrum complanatum]|uniref:Uncharacterized protein n=4 Tax=Diphasiastrum complanatum TaxID=34168 RepID=A0ACC2DL01_DIPCM|nr:hypothetical protein O6H91_Y217000 [Diphasiastrum complanatum]KAJ7295017.1 hypothetical protein O6H91_Y217000 [Diphasiastrum complanatum]KAJ7295018.1 hypothetical protein O6H91_Y217000 [Diphasiastrum complanatum]KAJ7295019.1 hypothetical protein O6H91_Y217000 [Diphasiastrum complanatum]KAJ7554897.1 hypothetical protein O6H91_05G014700 [Diphasiastrum complanatum]
MSASAETDSKKVGNESSPQGQEKSSLLNGVSEIDSAAAKDAGTAQGGKDSSSGGKIFIGGLSWETTTEKLTNHFKKYGELTDSVIMRDRESGHSRGFGFVTYADPSVVDRVLQEPQILDGRTVDCKRSVPRENMAAVKGPKTKKIFVGGISPSITEEEFKSHFSTFGKVVEHQIMVDHSTGRSRGFGFIIFDNEQTVEDILAQGKMHDFGGKQVEIKKAEPKRSQEPGSGPAHRGGYGSSGRAGYRGYDDGYSLAAGSGYGNAPYRPGGDYDGRNYGGYGGSYAGGYGSGGYGGTGIGVAGYGAGSYGGAYGGSLYEGGLGGIYGSSLIGSYLDDDYGGLGYGGYAGGGYGGGYGTGGGYGGGGSYGGSRGYGGIGSGRYHPYGRS